jgi:hypothetical protein
MTTCRIWGIKMVTTDKTTEQVNDFKCFGYKISNHLNEDLHEQLHISNRRGTLWRQHYIVYNQVHDLNVKCKLWEDITKNKTWRGNNGSQTQQKEIIGSGLQTINAVDSWYIKQYQLHWNDIWSEDRIPKLTHACRRKSHIGRSRTLNCFKFTDLKSKTKQNKTKHDAVHPVSHNIMFWFQNGGEVCMILVTVSRNSGFHGSKSEESCLLGCSTVWSGRSLPAFERYLLPPWWWRQQVPQKCW